MRTYEEISKRIKRLEGERDVAAQKLQRLVMRGRLPGRNTQKLIMERRRLQLNELYWLVGKRPIPNPNRIIPDTGEGW